MNIVTDRLPNGYSRRGSRLWKAGKMTESNCRTLSLWLDCHSLNLGAFHGEQAQKEGNL
ncbi:MAG: hypothetical protein ACOYOU_21835 [Kiritimatiellia bacterium]